MERRAEIKERSTYILYNVPRVYVRSRRETIHIIQWQERKNRNAASSACIGTHQHYRLGVGTRIPSQAAEYNTCIRGRERVTHALPSEREYEEEYVLERARARTHIRYN